MFWVWTIAGVLGVLLIAFAFIIFRKGNEAERRRPGMSAGMARRDEPTPFASHESMPLANAGGANTPMPLANAGGGKAAASLLDAAVGDTIEVAGQPFFRVDRKHRYESGGDEWFELVGQSGGQEVSLEICPGEDGLEVLLCEKEADLPLRKLNLTENDLVRMDESTPPAGSCRYAGMRWDFVERGEVLYYEDSGRNGEGFYNWNFNAATGEEVLYVEKWEDEPFCAGVSKRIDPDRVTLRRG